MTKQSSINHPSQERYDQALLEALKRQAVRVPLIMSVVIVVIAEFAVGQAPFWQILLWASIAMLMQILRSTIMFKLPSQLDKTASKRLRIASLLSLINGLILASSVILFSDMGEISRTAFSMIMIGLVAGTIASSYGYRPIFMAFVIPVLGSVIFVWTYTANESLSLFKLGSIIFLIIALGSVLYASSRDVYKAFVNSFAVSVQMEATLLAEQNANAAKTRFLAAASHDLKQPIHTLSLLTAALTLRDLDERSSAIAEKINLAMANLSSDLDSLLDISKLDASVVMVSHSVFDINTSVAGIVSEYAAATTIAITQQDTSQGKLVSDRFLFERIIRNLLDNAVKYTETGSVNVSVSQSSDAWKISIQDTGIGISFEEQDKIWEEFYQIGNSERDTQKGLGLGLSIVRRLTLLLKGEIHVESVLGEGSLFTVKIPIDSDDVLS